MTVFERKIGNSICKINDEMCIDKINKNAEEKINIILNDNFNIFNNL